VAVWTLIERALTTLSRAFTPSINSPRHWKQPGENYQCYYRRRHGWSVRSSEGSLEIEAPCWTYVSVMFTIVFRAVQDNEDDHVLGKRHKYYQFNWGVLDPTAYGIAFLARIWMHSAAEDLHDTCHLHILSIDLLTLSWSLSAADTSALRHRNCTFRSWTSRFQLHPHASRYCGQRGSHYI